MGSSRLAFVCALVLASGARAQKAVVVAQGLYEAPGLVVPVLLVQLPDANGNVLRLGVTGWTATGALSHPLSVTQSVVGELSVTPLFAHDSNRMYLLGAEHPELEFHDTSLQASAGLHWRLGEHVGSELRALLLKEWVRGLDAQTSELWRRPFAGVEGSATLEWLRSNDPFRTRADGLRIALHAQALGGAHTFARGELTLSGGREIGAAFLGLTAYGFVSSTSNLVARTLVGGSWDALEGLELVGHPQGALRLQNGAVVNARADLWVGRLLEVGLRGSAACGDGACHDGEGLALLLPISGAELTFGTAIADHQPGRWTVFAGMMVATLL